VGAARVGDERLSRTAGDAHARPAHLHAARHPLLRIPVNVGRSIAAMALPDGRNRAASRGQRDQEALLHTIIGDGEAKIGDSASHMSSVA
jgi:hypothetical protein